MESGRLLPSLQVDLHQARHIQQHCVSVEVIAFLCAISLYCCFESEFDFEPFQETARGKNKLDLSKLKNSIGQSTFDVDSSAATKKLKQKMARKYGHLSHTTDWSTEKKWWHFT